MRLICWLVLALSARAASIPLPVTSAVAARGHASVLVEIAGNGEADVLNDFRIELNGKCDVRHSWAAVRVMHLDAKPECLARLAASTAVVAVEVTGSAFLVAADSLEIPRYQRAAIFGGGLQGSDPELRQVFQQEACFCSGGCCPGGTARLTGENAAASTLPPARSTEQLALRVSRPGHAGIIDGTNITLVSIRVGESAISLASVLDALDWLVDQKLSIGSLVLSLESDEVYCGPCRNLSIANRAMAAYIDRLTANGVRVQTPDLGYGIRGAPACLPGVKRFPASLDLPRLAGELRQAGHFAAGIGSITTYSTELAPPAGWAAGQEVPPHVHRIEFQNRKAGTATETVHPASAYSFRNFVSESIFQNVRGLMYYLNQGSDSTFVLHLGQVSSCSISDLSKDLPIRR